MWTITPSYTNSPAITIDPSLDYYADVIFNIGSVVIKLFPVIAPITVNNFVFLAKEGFYDRCVFHRIVPNFIAQTGDPDRNGKGGPGYRIPDEISDTEFNIGIVGMANAGPNTNGSQFFITLSDAPHLRGRYTVFGEVVTGFDIVQKIVAAESEHEIITVKIRTILSDYSISE